MEVTEEKTMTPYQRYYALHREEKIAKSSAYYYAKQQVNQEKLAEKQLEKEHCQAIKKAQKEQQQIQRLEQKTAKEKERHAKQEEKERIREAKRVLAEQTRRVAPGLEKVSTAAQ